MTEANDPGRVLRLVFDNAVDHRQTVIATIERAASDLVRDALAAKQTAQTAKVQNKPFRHDMTSLAVSSAALQAAVTRLIGADIQIQNLEGLARHPDFKFFGTQAKEKKDASVTPIKSVTTPVAAPQTPGSKAPTGPKPPATNPALQRQRERKNAQDDK